MRLLQRSERKKERHFQSDFRRRRARRHCHLYQVVTLVTLVIFPSLATLAWLVDLCYLHLYSNPRGSRFGTIASILLSLKSDVILPVLQQAPPDLVDRTDYIYSNIHWDAAPVVVPQYKLIFFTVPKIGCTVWKQLFRRMMGLPDWQLQSIPNIPHNPSQNGLHYLYDFSQASANYMLTSPKWTRAIFTRDPKERVLSAYLDKVLQEKDYIASHCCPRNQTMSATTIKTATEKNMTSLESLTEHVHPRLKAICNKEQSHWTFKTFIQDVIPNCQDPHWMPQSDRMEPKYWTQINFVGRIESAASDARHLLEHLDAYHKYGTNFTSTEAIFASNAALHATNSLSQIQSFYTPELEQLVEEFYSKDYSNPILNLTMFKIPFVGRTNLSTPKD